MKHQPVQLPLFAEETLSVKSAAKHLGTSENTVRRLLDANILKGYRYTEGGWWNIFMYSLKEYEQYLRQRFAPDMDGHGQGKKGKK